MKRRLLSGTVSLMLISALFVGLDLSFDIIPNVSSGLIEVDDSGGKDYFTIQEGVDAAIPGDTVLVYAGIYNEDITISKTINLTGEDRDTTIINSTDKIGIYVTNADYVNITGFTVVNGSWTGIRLMPSNNSLVENVRTEKNEYGIQIIDSNNTVVRDNIVSNVSGNYYGIYILRSTNTTIDNNFCFNNDVGIWIQDGSNFNILSNNNCSYNSNGVVINPSCRENTFNDNNIYSNIWYGIWDNSEGGNIYINTTIQNNWVGFYLVTFTQDVQILNSTIKNSSSYDISISGSNTYLTTINTTFNKTKVQIDQITNELEVKWYLHININNNLGNPVPDSNVKIEDNINGLYIETLITDGNGKVKWIPVTEYIERKSGKTFYSPHKIMAWNDTLVGYAYPEPIMNKSKIVTIILFNGTFLKLERGWNLISLPRVQSITNLQIVLQSIEQRYDSVQWYNVTDGSDPWKHYHISKPSFMNDLEELNHSKGFWLHIIDPQGTTLAVFGDELIVNQSITINPGWNLVGYPSLINRTRDMALNNINFSTEVDSIWTFNSTIEKWIELNEITDYFEIGQGYWIHSKVTKVWNVPL